METVTLWINGLQEGDGAAIERIFQRYFPQLVRVARSKIPGMSRAERDEEDIALSAMETFFRRAENGEFDRLNNRDELQRLLFWITATKAVAERRRRLTAKRDNRRVICNAASSSTQDDPAAMLDEVMSGFPTADEEAEFKDDLRTALARLADDSLEQVLLLRLEGYTNGEISQKLDTPLSTLEKKIQRIRNKLEPLLQPNQELLMNLANPEPPEQDIGRVPRSPK